MVFAESNVLHGVRNTGQTRMAFYFIKIMERALPDFMGRKGLYRPYLDGVHQAPEPLVASPLPAFTMASRESCIL